MNLSFKILGFEIASLTLELSESTPDLPVVDVVPTLAAKGAKWMSKHWVRAMMR